MSQFSSNPDNNELLFGLTRLSFEDNFDAFIKKDLTIAAGAEAEIANGLPTRRIPAYYIILRQTGDSRVIDGTVTDWSRDAVYLSNVGSNEVTITVVFFGE